MAHFRDFVYSVGPIFFATTVHCDLAERKIRHFGDQAILCRIVAIAETWIRDFEPELKSQVPLGQKKFINSHSKVCEFLPP